MIHIELHDVMLVGNNNNYYCRDPSKVVEKANSREQLEFHQNVH